MAKYCLKDYQGAIEDLNEAIELDSKNTKYYYGRGIANKVLKNINAAILDFTSAIKLDDTHTKAYLEKSKLVFEKDYKKALELLLTALKNCKDNKDFIFTALSFVYFSQNDYKKALKYANEAILFNKECGTGYYRKYCALTALGKQDEARKYFEKANKFGYEKCF